VRDVVLRFYIYHSSVSEKQGVKYDDCEGYENRFFHDYIMYIYTHWNQLFLVKS